MCEFSVAMSCPHCLAGDRRWGGRLTLRRIVHKYLPSKPICADWDVEFRYIGEPFGFFLFAWLPVKCRNRRVRWLTWVEKHRDGTCTLGNRAH